MFTVRSFTAALLFAEEKSSRFSKKPPSNKTLNTCTQCSVSIQEFNLLERIENKCIFRTLVTK